MPEYSRQGFYSASMPAPEGDVNLSSGAHVTTPGLSVCVLGDTVWEGDSVRDLSLSR